VSGDREKIARLQRRADHLRARIAADPGRSYDKSELSALEWAIKRLSGAEPESEPPADSAFDHPEPPEN
jgi:hypothetical protein